MSNFSIETYYLKKARRVTIRLMPNKKIRVTAPYGIKESDIKKIVLSKSKWILEKQKILESIAPVPKVEFVSGVTLPFYGEELTLKIVEGSGQTFKKDNELIVFVPKNKKETFVRLALIKWYQAQALELITERATYYSQMLGVTPKSISIKNYRARWGSCSSKKDLIFNWQIITFSKTQFDYVIAHEVCHIKEMNHSERFYKLLNQLGFNKREIKLQFRHLRNLF